VIRASPLPRARAGDGAAQATTALVLAYSADTVREILTVHRAELVPHQATFAS
jgi:hypothetical protein